MSYDHILTLFYWLFLSKGYSGVLPFACVLDFSRLSIKCATCRHPTIVWIDSGYGAQMQLAVALLPA
uniref:Secreted protein n=1 Tax=Heterorhabditis bacteriophora TaxID=37862 RepID=A0A1I7XCA7_HETBA